MRPLKATARRPARSRARTISPTATNRVHLRRAASLRVGLTQWWRATRPRSLRAMAILAVAGLESRKRIVVPPCAPPPPATAKVDGETDKPVTAMRSRVDAVAANAPRERITTGSTTFGFSIGKTSGAQAGVHYRERQPHRRTTRRRLPPHTLRTRMARQPWLGREPSRSTGPSHRDAGLLRRVAAGARRGRRDEEPARSASP